MMFRFTKHGLTGLSLILVWVVLNHQQRPVLASPYSIGGLYPGITSDDIGPEWKWSGDVSTTSPVQFLNTDGVDFGVEIGLKDETLFYVRGPELETPDAVLREGTPSTVIHRYLGAVRGNPPADFDKARVGIDRKTEYFKVEHVGFRYHVIVEYEGQDARSFRLSTPPKMGESQK